MKIVIAAFVLLLSPHIRSIAQNNVLYSTSISTTTKHSTSDRLNLVASKKNIKNLYDLGLIWGFLKYYHPNVVKGKFDWDQELFEMIPQVLNSKNQNERDSIFTEWIKGLGRFCKSKKLHFESHQDSIKYMPDLDWIQQSNYSKELVRILTKVKKGKRPKTSYYVSLESPAGNPSFDQEIAYDDSAFINTNHRLLALFRYWNIIEYFFPYKTLIDRDWKNSLLVFIPKFLEASNELEYIQAIQELITHIDDTHAIITSSMAPLDEYYGLNWSPAILTFIEGKTIVTGYHNDSLGQACSLKIGDIVTKIDQKPIDTIVSERERFVSASNSPTRLRNISDDLLRTPRTTLQVEYIHKGIKTSAKLKTYSSEEMPITSRFVSTDTSFRLLTPDIAYIDHGTLKRKHLKSLWPYINQKQGLIIDLRNYPSDFPGMDLCEYLFPSEKTFCKISKGSSLQPGLFYFKTALNIGKENKDYFKGKLVILVNETTQSSAEFHAMMYQMHPNAVVLGSTTAGADGNVSYLVLPGGIKTRFSGIGIYYADGSETQRVGIVPDIQVKPTIKGVSAKRDELIEAAIDLISK